MSDIYLFQYCVKLAVLSRDGSKVLLCRRTGEQDYDGVFSLIGGKMEHGDGSIVEALRREKSEEVGAGFRVRVLPRYSVDVYFVKNDGSRMILPHYLAQHAQGDVSLNDEYSEAAWVDLAHLDAYEPKISNISWIVPSLVRLSEIADDADFVEL